MNEEGIQIKSKSERERERVNPPSRLRTGNARKILIFFAVILLAAFCFIPNSASAAAITSAQSGNWSSTSTWTGGVVPGEGDTATINHNVTVDVNTTIGTSPNDTTTNVLIMGTATLTIDTDVTLTVKGNVSKKGAIHLNAGASFLFDSSATGQYYTFNGASVQQIRIFGESNNRCTFGAVSGQRTGNFLVGWSTAGNGFHAEYCDFQNLGNDGGSGFSLIFSSDYGTIDNCTFDNCRRVVLTATTEPYVFTNNTITNPSNYNGYCLTLGGTSTVASGARTVTGNVFVGGNVGVDTKYDITFEDNYVYGSVLHTTGTFTSWQNNFIFGWEDLTPITTYRSMNRTYLMTNGQVNSHLLNVMTQYGDVEIDQFIFHTDNSDISSDATIFQPTCDVANVATITRSVYLPNVAGTGAGTNFQYADSGDNARIVYEHNTVIVSDDGESGVCVGYSNHMNAGKLESFKSNIFHTPSGKTPGFKAWRSVSSAVQDLIDPTEIDYNWASNLAEGTEGNGFQDDNSTNDMFTVNTSTLDINGGSGDPEFVDETRTLPLYDTASWGLENVQGTAWADATAYVVGDVVSAATAGFYGGATINYRCITAHTSEAGHATNGKPGAVATFRTNWEYQSAYRLRENTSRISSLIDAIFAGFAPTNAALRGTAHDSGDIGAVANSNTAPSISYTSPDTWNTGDMTITYSLTDADADTNTLTVQYSTDNSNWSTATQGSGGDGTTGLASSSGGTSHTFVWDTATDLPTTEDSTVYIKITPSDGGGGLSAYTTDSFGVDNVNPTVSAGDDQTKTASFTQTATATDSGGINASTYQWAKVSGSGTVTFGTATALSTTITADTDGTYVISFTASDNAGNSNSDTFTLTWSNATTTTAGGGAPPSLFFDVSVSPGPNGKISPSWGLMFYSGTSQTFNITPNSGYQIADVLIDGVSIGAQPSYTFSSINNSHSISATFSKVGTEQTGTTQQTTQTEQSISSQQQENTQTTTQEQTSSQKEAVIAQLKQQLITLITQVIQMLYEQIALMKS